MPRPWRPYEIHPRAWMQREGDDFPVLLSDVVDALIALPPERCIDSQVVVPAVLRDAREGIVFGARFLMIGMRAEFGGA